MKLATTTFLQEVEQALDYTLLSHISSSTYFQRQSDFMLVLGTGARTTANSSSSPALSGIKRLCLSYTSQLLAVPAQALLALDKE